jgi:hypothetical protein
MPPRTDKDRGAQMKEIGAARVLRRARSKLYARSRLHITRGGVPALLAGSAITLALAGCGSSSSSSSTSSTSTSSAHAVAAHPHAIPAVASPAGAVAPAKAGLRRLRRVAKGAGFAAHLAGLGKLPLTQAVQEVSGDLNKFWSSEFASSGVQWPAMQDVIVDSSPVQTQCSSGRATVAPTEPWYLCDGSSGGTFYWTIPWMQQNVATDAGGVNLAFSMAEMWAFHIQNLFGFTAQLQSGSLPKGQWAQQSVCLTGIYVRSLSDRKLFEQGDQQTVQNFITSLSGVAGIGAPDVSSQQLQQAFSAGFNSGAPSTCGVSGNGGGSGTATSTTTSGGGPIPVPSTTTS